MKKTTRPILKRSLAALAFALLGGTPLVHAHQHIVAGAASTGQLQFISGSFTDVTFHLLPETGPYYQGYLALDEEPRTDFPNDYFTFTAASDGQTEDAQPGHAATGADIWMEITSVSGPAGASFGYWEADWAHTHNTPSQSFLTNTPTGGFKFELSEPLSFLPPDQQDPYGHIHDRGWTVSQPGDYYVGFTLYDLSHVGPNGGPLQTPSQTYTFHFLAVPEPGSSALLLLALASSAAVASRRRRPFSLSPVQPHQTNQ